MPDDYRFFFQIEIYTIYFHFNALCHSCPWVSLFLFSKTKNNFQFCSKSFPKQKNAEMYTCMYVCGTLRAAFVSWYNEYIYIYNTHITLTTHWVLWTRVLPTAYRYSQSYTHCAHIVLPFFLFSFEFEFLFKKWSFER